VVQVLKSRRAITIIVVAATTLAVAPAAAWACDPHDNNSARTATFLVSLDGWERGVNSSTVWDSIQSDIEVRNPFIYNDPGETNLTNFTYGWIMLVNDSLTTWAQIGPSRENSGTRHNKIQCANANTQSITNFLLSPSDVGTEPRYKVQQVGSSGKDFYINGSKVQNCLYTFTAQAGFSKTETHNRRDQVHGDTTNHQGWQNATITDSGGATTDLLSSGAFEGNGPSWLHVHKGGSDHMEGWDGDCSS
jgi:hypothetical protein